MSLHLVVVPGPWTRLWPLLAARWYAQPQPHESNVRLLDLELDCDLRSVRRGSRGSCKIASDRYSCTMYIRRAARISTAARGHGLVLYVIYAIFRPANILSVS